jgi:hypothetical protein
MLGNGPIRSRREWAVRRYLLRTIVPGADHDEATDHAATERAHLNIDREMDASSEAGPFGFVGAFD